MTTLPTLLEGLPRQTHIGHHEVLHAAHNARSKIVNVLENGVYGDGRDDTTALNNLLQNVEAGADLHFPNTGNKYKASHLYVTKPVTFSGEGWFFSNKPAFGSAGWDSPTLTGGSVLQCTATSGIFIDVQYSGFFNLRNILIQGSGNNTSAATGVKYPGGDDGSYLNGGGVYYTADNFWQNAGIGNFKTGVRMYTTYTSAIQSSWLVGCDKGMWLGHEANHLGFNTTQISMVNCSGCNIGIQCDNVGYSDFSNVACQGYFDVGLKLNWVFNCEFVQPYFESLTGNYSIDTVDCASCRFINGNFGGDPDTATKMRLGKFDTDRRSNNNILICGSGFNTLIIDAAYKNTILFGNPTYITGLDTGINNNLIYYKTIGVTPASVEALTIKMALPDAPHKSALVLENCNLGLMSPDNSIWVQTISNAGVATWTKMT